MALVEFDTNLTDEGKAVLNEARRFFREVWRPAAIKLDKLPSPEDVIAKDSLFWDVLRQTYHLGYNKMGFPVEMGGSGLRDPLARAMITEEMGYASADLAICLGVCSMPFSMAMASPHPDLREMVRQYAEDTEAKMIGCWAITEPDHGSDWLYFDSAHHRDPEVIPQVTAVLDGDHYIINGQKSAWVSNGTIATHAALFLNGFDNILMASVGTDGSDGPTDAAGALADGKTIYRAEEKGLDIIKHVNNNDSYHFFESLDDLIKTGPTNTNVMDIRIMLIAQ